MNINKSVVINYEYYDYYLWNKNCVIITIINNLKKLIMLNVFKSLRVKCNLSIVLKGIIQ